MQWFLTGVGEGYQVLQARALESNMSSGSFDFSGWTIVTSEWNAAPY